MAKTAMREADEKAAVEANKPDFERAIRVMANDIKASDEANAQTRGDLSAAWKVVEDECRCVKGAAKVFFKLRGMSPETRDDYLRTLYGLMEADGIGISRDLVDQAEGVSKSMPLAPAAADEPDRGDKPEFDAAAPSPVDQMLAGEAKRRGKAPDELGGGPRKAGTKPAAKKPNLPTLRAVN